MTDTTNTPEEQLAQLRGDLNELDQRLIETAANRVETIKRIRALKAKQGFSLFDRQREREVYERAQKSAKALHLDPQIATALMQILVEASHHLQSEQSDQDKQDSKGPSRKILIVGGEGQMGRLFANAFRQRGHQIAILEKSDGVDRPAAVNAAEIIIISVPMNDAVEVASQLAPYVRADAMLCDFNSLKQEICQVFHDRCNGEALGTHPMFGPTVRTLRRQKVITCHVRKGPLCDWFTTELGRLGLELTETTPEIHDRMMAVVQVLTHFRTLVMGRALSQTGVPVEDSLQFTSPIYRLELAVVGRLFAQDPELYAEIEMSNPYGPEFRDRFLNAAKEVDETIASGDRTAFTNLFKSVATYFRGFSEEAMGLSDYLIEALVSRP